MKKLKELMPEMEVECVRDNQTPEITLNTEISLLLSTEGQEESLLFSLCQTLIAPYNEIVSELEQLYPDAFLCKDPISIEDFSFSNSLNKLLSSTNSISELEEFCCMVYSVYDTHRVMINRTRHFVILLDTLNQIVFSFLIKLRQINLELSKRIHQPIHAMNDETNNADGRDPRYQQQTAAIVSSLPNQSKDQLLRFFENLMSESDKTKKITELLAFDEMRKLDGRVGEAFENYVVADASYLLTHIHSSIAIAIDQQGWHPPASFFSNVPDSLKLVIDSDLSHQLDQYLTTLPLSVLHQKMICDSNDLY